jgi:2-oxoglutarate dehydrogenase E2 component (dihydrolipoamide succinyltransferase)
MRSTDEPLVELETDKVTVEVPAPAAGTLGEIVVKEGETVEVGALLGMLEAEGAPRPRRPPAAAPLLPPKAAGAAKAAKLVE